MDFLHSSDVRSMNDGCRNFFKLCYPDRKLTLKPSQMSSRTRCEGLAGCYSSNQCWYSNQGADSNQHPTSITFWRLWRHRVHLCYSSTAWLEQFLWRIHLLAPHFLSYVVLSIPWKNNKQYGQFLLCYNKAAWIFWIHYSTHVPLTLAAPGHVCYF